ncbi:MAG: hypothetical protein LBI05_09140, partial [Planctomycetaceae bacterium]|nr:hypothetical protein [Planctomycetaceae bacterium]
MSIDYVHAHNLVRRPATNFRTWSKRPIHRQTAKDGTCVHVRNDAGKPVYCEMKVGALVKREPGEGTSAENVDDRDLPKPTVVSAFAAIENKEEFQKRCQNERRLGVGGVTSALGDGALWIWSLVFMVFGKTMECLDIFHALEHVATCGKELLGSGEV